MQYHRPEAELYIVQDRWLVVYVLFEELLNKTSSVLQPFCCMFYSKIINVTVNVMSPRNADVI